MRTRLNILFEELRSSFWFLPALMTMAGIALSFAAIQADGAFSQEVLSHIGWLYSGSAEGARSVLAAIAGSMITVAGVVSSITVVILSLASQQFGPRILRTFIRDRANQAVLGAFVSTFIYCLLVLRTVRGGSGSAFVPHISVTAGIVLAAVSIAVLIFFVHHVARSIQASSIIAAIGHELEGAIDRLYPEEVGDEESDREEPSGDESERVAQGTVIPSSATGYVQLVDGSKLLELGARHDLAVVVLADPGAFVRRGDRLAVVSGGTCDDRLRREMGKAFTIADHRTGTQDIGFLFQQLTEIAVRALSPGTNDPFTAVQCVNQLSASLAQLAEREAPSSERRDDSGKVRVVTHPARFPGIAAAALSPIRRYGCSHQEVIFTLLERIGEIAAHTRRAADRDGLIAEARRVVEAASAWKDERAVRDVQGLFRDVCRQAARPHSGRSR